MFTLTSHPSYPSHRFPQPLSLSLTVSLCLFLSLSPSILPLPLSFPPSLCFSLPVSPYVSVSPSSLEEEGQALWFQSAESTQWPVSMSHKAEDRETGPNSKASKTMFSI